jgi:hypothetical protein
LLTTDPTLVFGCDGQADPVAGGPVGCDTIGQKTACSGTEMALRCLGDPEPRH